MKLLLFVLFVSCQYLHAFSFIVKNNVLVESGLQHAGNTCQVWRNRLGSLGYKPKGWWFKPTCLTRFH